MPISRDGIRLTPIKARIFDLVSARPGITARELAGLIYEQVTEATTASTKSHIWQMRDLGVEIHGQQYAGYHIRKHHHEEDR
jgi:hypothetical protein